MMTTKRWWITVGLAWSGALPAAAQPAGEWYAGAALATARADHAMALTSGGELVVVGGENSTGLLSSIEVLDPGALAWRAGAAMPASVAGAAAVTLRDGRVLVVGGRIPDLVATDRRSTTLARLYDPGANTWAVAAAMSASRHQHTATLLGDGRVLVTGGVSRVRVGAAPPADTPLRSAEIYDPTTNAWTAVPDLSTARYEHTATRLADGRVLVVGGLSASSSPARGAEIFDPATRTWSGLIMAPVDWSSHRAVLGLDGQVYVWGVIESIRRFDPLTRLWSDTARTATGLRGSASLLADGSIVHTGGFDFFGGVERGASVFTPPSTLSALDTGFGTRDRATSVRMPGGEVVVVGGVRGGAYLAETRVFAPSMVVDRNVGAMASAPQLRAYDEVAQLPDGRWVVVGTEGSSIVHDPATNVWTSVGTAGFAGAAVTTLAGGKVMAVGGGGFHVTPVRATSNASLFDPQTSTWSTVAPLTTARGSATATRLFDGRVLVVGGDLTTTTAEIYDPETGLWRTIGGPAQGVVGHTATLMLDGSVIVVAGYTLTGVSTAVYRFDPVAEAWSTRAATPEARCFGSAAVLSNGELMIAGGRADCVGQIRWLGTTFIYAPATNLWRAGPVVSVADTPHGPSLHVLPSGGAFWRGGPATQNASAGLLISGPSSTWRTLDGSVSARGHAAAGLRARGDFFVVGGADHNGNPQADGFILRPFGSDPIRTPSFTLPARITGAGPLTITGTRLLATAAGDHGRPNGVAADAANARLMTLDGRLSWPLRGRSASATSLTVDIPAVPPGHYMLFVNAAGNWSGAITRIGNRLPVARPVSVSMLEDTAREVVVSGGDRDGDDITYRISQAPTRGTLSGTGPRFAYAPRADFAGTDTFRYRTHDGIAEGAEAIATITVTPVNDAPVAAADTYRTPEDTELRVAAAQGLIANDRDVDSTVLTVVPGSVSRPARGTVLVAADGSFIYTPRADISGQDAFSYRASDGSAESLDVTVTIDITPVDDAPVARADRYTTAEDEPLRLPAGSSVLTNDTDVDSTTLTATLAAGPLHGQLTLAADGTFRYVPEPNFFGMDRFTYRASDGTSTSSIAEVTLEVTSVNDVPVSLGDEYQVSVELGITVTATLGVLINDTDADGDPLVALLVAPPRDGVLSLERDGSFRYTPRPGFEGVDDFGYQASDGVDRATPVVVRLHVRGDRPVAVADSYTMREDEPLSVDRFRGVLTNDDGRGQALTAQIVETVEHGFLSLREDGSFEYVPEPNASGRERFRYRASNGAFDSEVVDVTIEITPVNDPPSAPLLLEPGDGARVPADRLTFAWQAATDVDGDTLVYTLEVSTAGGEVVRELFAGETFLGLEGADMLEPGRYTWRVAAHDGRDARGDYASPRAFTVLTEDGREPGPPGEDSGCGCSTATSPADLSPWALFLCIVLLIRRRR